MIINVATITGRNLANGSKFMTNIETLVINASNRAMLNLMPAVEKHTSRDPCKLTVQ